MPQTGHKKLSPNTITSYENTGRYLRDCQTKGTQDSFKLGRRKTSDSKVDKVLNIDAIDDEKKFIWFTWKIKRNSEWVLEPVWVMKQTRGCKSPRSSWTYTAHLSLSYKKTMYSLWCSQVAEHKHFRKKISAALSHQIGIGMEEELSELLNTLPTAPEFLYCTKKLSDKRRKRLTWSREHLWACLSKKPNEHLFLTSLINMSTNLCKILKKTLSFADLGKISSIGISWSRVSMVRDRDDCAHGFLAWTNVAGSLKYVWQNLYCWICWFSRNLGKII